tara:strand:+ start:922 stop:1146 length:225 start_codon:yes stop_codon:yes gene_type:complete
MFNYKKKQMNSQMEVTRKRLRFAVGLRHKRKELEGNKKAQQLLNKISWCQNNNKLHTLTGRAYKLYLEILKSTK